MFTFTVDTLGYQVEPLVWYIEGLKNKKPSAANTKKIITALHSGFDNLIEQSLFEDNIPLLIKKNGSFKHIEKELHTFF